MADNPNLFWGTERPGPEALQQMRERGGSWLATSPMDMSSSTLGELRFPSVRQGRTFDIPAWKYPDSTFSALAGEFLALLGIVI